MRNFKWTLLLSIMVVITGCGESDEGPHLVDPNFKQINLKSGGTYHIQILVPNWSIDHIKDLNSNSIIVDTEGNPLSLDHYGKVKSENGKVELVRFDDNKFYLTLSENLGAETLSLRICIKNGLNRDFIKVIQKRGKSYRLVNEHYEETEELREIYQSEEGCKKISFTNNGTEPVWQLLNDIYDEIYLTSEFESDDPDAFIWAEEDFEIHIPRLIINGDNWMTGLCPYKQGKNLKPVAVTSIHRVLIDPSQTKYISGSVEYCSRVGIYTFTVRNEDTGYTFKISGRWSITQPIIWNSTISDTPF